MNIDQSDLDQLARYYGSDKTPGQKHHYTQFYASWLLPQRQNIRKVVEIGIGSPEVMFPGYRRGASLYMWRDYLPQAWIFGADIRPDLLFSEDRISTFLCDQTDLASLDRLLGHTGLDVDLFVDDGSHVPRHQIDTCKTILPKLWERVLYFIEDVSRPDTVRRELRAAGFQTELLEAVERRHHDDRLMRVWL